MPKNTIPGWKDCEITEEEHATMRAIALEVFKRNGGRGEMPPVSWKKWNSEGTIAFDVRSFEAGNEAPDASDGQAKLAKQWAESIANGNGSLDDLKEHPAFQKMVATLLKRSSAPPPPPAASPPPPPIPSPKMKGGHSVAKPGKAAPVGTKVFRKTRAA